MSLLRKYKFMAFHFEEKFISTMSCLCDGKHKLLKIIIKLQLWTTDTKAAGKRVERFCVTE